MDKQKTVQDVLWEAAQQIRSQPYLGTGVYVDSNQCMCTMGAIYYSATGRTNPISSDLTHPLVGGAKGRVTTVLLARKKGDRIVTWNDWEATQAEVVEVLTEAANLP